MRNTYTWNTRTFLFKKYLFKNLRYLFFRYFSAITDVRNDVIMQLPFFFYYSQTFFSGQQTAVWNWTQQKTTVQRNVVEQLERLEPPFHLLPLLAISCCMPRSKEGKKSVLRFIVSVIDGGHLRMRIEATSFIKLFLWKSFLTIVFFNKAIYSCFIFKWNVLTQKIFLHDKTSFMKLAPSFKERYRQEAAGNEVHCVWGKAR